MVKDILIAADDFGLTRGITDTILETVDKGPVTLVSVIPNGEAVAYAIEEYKKRSERLTLAVHLNLTEGPALSAQKDVSFLVDAAGNFKYGVMGLWVAYSTAGPGTQSRFREQVRREMSVQLARIREASGLEQIAVNGHQHVHLVPFVFDELIQIPNITAVRTVREPFAWSWSFASMFARTIVVLLSSRSARIARSHCIATNDSFIGFLNSGHMTKKIFRDGLSRTKGSVEVLFHPGSATAGELVSWQGGRADLRWHYSSWRTNERETLLNWGK